MEIQIKESQKIEGVNFNSLQLVILLWMKSLLGKHNRPYFNSTEPIVYIADKKLFRFTITLISLVRYSMERGGHLSM